jgi:carbamoyltransferase
MNILGMCGGVRQGNWDSAAALVVDGEVKAAAEEERFTRVKHAPGTLPTHAIRYCLGEAGLAMRDVDVVVYPGRTYANMVARLEDYFGFVHGHAPRIELCDHHEAHAASAFLSSGFEDSLVFTADYSGDGIASTVWRGAAGSLEALRRWEFPQSLGLFYAMVTQYLGFDFGEDEYKVMGLASYGEPTHDLNWLLRADGALGYALDAAAMRRTDGREPGLSTQERFFSDVLPQRLGPARLKNAPLTRHHQDVAASAQRQLETTVLRVVEAFLPRAESRNLCLAGGVAMNCVMNQKLAESGWFDRVFVPPVAGDNGLALGAALLYAAQVDRARLTELRTAALGPSYGNDAIRKALEEVGARYEEVADPSRCAAELIADGHIIGWFQGRMEYGARALGHRSILADPRIAEMKDRVNAVVKFREGFRPFAPSVVEEEAGRFFANSRSAPFMTFTFDVPERARDMIPAVTHADNTARVQTVAADAEPAYHALISEVGRETGVPVVLNTSFNIKGQAIVENPNQAISTFYGSGLTALVMGNYLLRKKT